jgi:hypothetical protein
MTNTEALEKLICPFGYPIGEYQIQWSDISKVLGKVRGRFFVYLLIKNKEVIYAGRSQCLYERLCQHKYRWEFDSIYLLEYAQYHECAAAEKKIVLHYAPKENRMWVLFGNKR